MAQKPRQSNRNITLFLVRERLRTALPVALGIIGIIAAVVLSKADFSSERGKVEGVITGSTWKDGTTLRSKVLVYVHLDDGRSIVGTGHWHNPPHEGDRITLSERVSPFGAVSYVVPETSQ